jgi:DNA-nicking Smr family endonuclease
MDFGDILDQWDRQTARARKGRKDSSGSGKTGNKPARTDGNDRNNRSDNFNSNKSIDPLEAWLRANGVYDKDAEAETARADDAGARRRRLLAKTADAVLDLHGLTRNEAWTALDTFFGSSRRRGYEKILVIHGKGNHSRGETVLSETVRTFIERCPFAGESGRGRAAMGGSGATWVLLKETR